MKKRRATWFSAFLKRIPEGFLQGMTDIFSGLHCTCQPKVSRDEVRSAHSLYLMSLYQIFQSVNIALFESLDGLFFVHIVLEEDCPPLSISDNSQKGWVKNGIARNAPEL